jgi:hypothetical protein
MRAFRTLLHAFLFSVTSFANSHMQLRFVQTMLESKRVCVVRSEKSSTRGTEFAQCSQCGRSCSLRHVTAVDPLACVYAC